MLDDDLDVWKNVLMNMKVLDIIKEKYDKVNNRFQPLYREILDVLEKCKDFRIIGYNKDTIKQKPKPKICRKQFQSTPEEYWICNKCNYPNPISYTECIACNTSK